MPSSALTSAPLASADQAARRAARAPPSRRERAARVAPRGAAAPPPRTTAAAVAPRTRLARVRRGPRRGSTRAMSPRSAPRRRHRPAQGGREGRQRPAGARSLPRAARAVAVLARCPPVHVVRSGSHRPRSAVPRIEIDRRRPPRRPTSASVHGRTNGAVGAVMWPAVDPSCSRTADASTFAH